MNDYSGETSVLHLSEAMRMEKPDNEQLRELNIMPIRDEEKRGICIIYFCFAKIKMFCIPNEILSSVLDFPRLGRCDFLTSESNSLPASRIVLSFSLLSDYIS